MCAYKRVTVQFDYWGLKKRAETMIHQVATVRSIVECANTIYLFLSRYSEACTCSRINKSSVGWMSGSTRTWRRSPLWGTRYRKRSTKSCGVPIPSQSPPSLQHGRKALPHKILREPAVPLRFRLQREKM